MSYTLTAEGWNMHFNADLSGVVTLVSPDDGSEARVPFGVLAEFVGSALLGSKVAALEAMTGIEYLSSIT